MKFKTYIEDARENLISSLKHIGDIRSKKQVDVIERANKVIKWIDSLLEVVEREPYSPLDLKPTDPASEQMKKLWEELDKNPTGEYKLMVMRLEPQMIKGIKISGYLKTFHLPTTIPDIIEEIGVDHGGGKFQIKIVDGAGKYVKSKTFEISGLPKIQELESEKTTKVSELESGKTAKVSEPPEVENKSFF